MLSVSPWSVSDTDEIRQLTAHFASDYNRIEVAVSQLSAAGLQAAINQAAQTIEDDLIIVQMDSFAAGTAALRADIANQGKLVIDIDSWNFGGVSIVAMDGSGSTVAIGDLLARSEIVVSGNTFYNNVLYFARPDYKTCDAPAGGVAPAMRESQALLGMDEYYNDARFSHLTGTGYTTVIIDSGIYYDHVDFAGKIVYSYDFAGDFGETPDDDASDINGHGTHVASIAAAWDHGIARTADIIALKVFPDDADAGASSVDIAAALQWVIDNAALYNIVNVNMSLGGGNFQERGDYTYMFGGPEFDSHLHALGNMGIVVSVATGNAYDVYSFFGYPPGIGAPSTNTSVVSVSATYDESGRGTTYGSISQVDTIVDWAQRAPGLVDILAPGSWITAAAITGPTETREISGTSMSAPMVAGASVLAQQIAEEYLGRRLTVDEFKTITAQTGVLVVDDVDYGFEPTFADYYRIDVYAMALAIYDMGEPEPPPPSEPLYSSAQTAESITLRWDAQSATSFIIQYRIAGSSQWTEFSRRPAGSATSEVVRNLASGTEYEFRICAVNGTVQSNWSESIFVSTLPGRPPGFVSTAQTTNSVTLIWGVQSGVTGYTLQYRVAGTNAWQTWTEPAINAASATITGLSSGTSYEFRLTATNVSGADAAMASVATKGSSANANPVKPKVSNSSTLSTITLTWTHNERNTAGYTVTCTSHSIPQSQIAVTQNNGLYTAVISGLNASTTYKFSVTASNGEGKTAVTKVSAKTVKYAAPKDVKVLKNSATIGTLSLSMPTNVLPETDRYDIKVFAPKMKTNGPALATIQLTFANGTSVVTSDNADITAAVNGNRLVIGGLFSGLKYSFTVQAFSGNVDSAIAKTSGSTLKYTAVNINRVDGRVPEPALSWTVPTRNVNPADYQQFVVEVYLASDKKLKENLVGTTVIIENALGGVVTGTSTRILNLQSGEKYTIVVYALSADGVNESLTAKTSVKMA